MCLTRLGLQAVLLIENIGCLLLKNGADNGGSTTHGELVSFFWGRNVSSFLTSYSHSRTQKKNRRKNLLFVLLDLLGVQSIQCLQGKLKVCE